MHPRIPIFLTYKVMSFRFEKILSIELPKQGRLLRQLFVRGFVKFLGLQQRIVQRNQRAPKERALLTVLRVPYELSGGIDDRGHPEMVRYRV